MKPSFMTYTSFKSILVKIMESKIQMILILTNTKNIPVSTARPEDVPLLSYFVWDVPGLNRTKIGF